MENEVCLLVPVTYFLDANRPSSFDLSTVLLPLFHFLSAVTLSSDYLGAKYGELTWCLSNA
jgi:hypothetical protein